MKTETTSTHERQIMVSNIQKYNVYDGPGIRTIIFFKGCPVRCKWCANPEALSFHPDIMYKETLCTPHAACAATCPLGQICFTADDEEHPIDIRKLDKKPTEVKTEDCPRGAVTMVGEMKTIPELLKIIHEDDAFYDISGGGVTLSGGECTAQDGALALLRACKEDGLNTAIETCGFTPTKKMLAIAEYVDLFLYDIKQMDSKRHNELTGVGNERILHNAEELLKGGFNIKIRMPMLKEINDSHEEIQAVIDFLMPYKDFPNFKGIDLLPYHKLGVNKYKQLGIDYQIEGDPSLSEKDLDRIEGWISAYNFPVSVIRH